MYLEMLIIILRQIKSRCSVNFGKFPGKIPVVGFTCSKVLNLEHFYSADSALGTQSISAFSNYRDKCRGVLIILILKTYSPTLY